MKYLAAILILSGQAKDLGFKIVNGQIMAIKGSDLKVTVNKNKVTVKAL